MIKTTAKTGLLCLIISSLAIGPAQVRAQETDQHEHAVEKKDGKEATPRKSGVIPFHGKLKAVDKTAKTISIGESTIQITSDTKLIKTDKPATLEEAVIGEPVGGAYKKSADGKLVATMVRFGAKPEAMEADAKPEKKSKKKTE
jgi:hypothetical protein